MNIGRAIFLLLVMGTLTSVLSAGPTVVFTDGRSMRVDEVQRVDGIAHLFLEDGGRLSVPDERVANWDEISSAGSGAGPVEREANSDPRSHEDWIERSAAWRQAAGPFAEVIGVVSERHAVDPALLTAMAQVESALDPLAVSPKGAGGLLQLMPETAHRFGVTDVFDAAQNLEGGARYITWLLDRYDGRTDLALAGYNAGEGAVDRHAGIPPYRETQAYVRQVLEGAARLADLAP